MRELSEATMDRIEFALVDQEAVLDDIGNSPERVDTARALAEFREWRAGREKATEPGVCLRCQGDGMGPYDRQPYYPGSRAIPCSDCNGTGKRNGGG